MADTWNPFDKGANVTLTNGDRTATSTSAAATNTRSIVSHSTGQYHFEFTVDNLAAGDVYLGIESASSAWPGSGDAKYAMWRSNNFWNFNNTAASMGGASFGWRTGDTCAVEVDFGAKIIRFQNFTRSSGWSADLDISYITGGPWFVNLTPLASGHVFTINDGQAAYAVTPTSGFGAWSPSTGGFFARHYYDMARAS